MNFLLVEDDDADAVLLQLHLEPMLDQPLTRVQSLSLAYEAINEQRFDVALLDLALPDAWGLDALLRFSRRVPDVHVIVLTGSQEPAFADKARRAGALGFVSKALPPEQIALDVLALARSAGEKRAGEAELLGLSRFGGPARLTATSQVFGGADLHEANPEVWSHHVARYGDLLDLVLEEATFSTKLNTSEHLRAYAGELGAIGAGPRDVVSIHTAALRQRLETANGVGVDAVVSESRLVVLETMGHLAAHYRTAALGREQNSSGGDTADTGGAES